LARWLRIGQIGIIIVAVGAALGGCGPKRVTSRGVVAEPEIGTSDRASQPAPVLVDSGTQPALPEPKPLSRSGDDVISAEKSTSPALGPRAVELARAQLGKPYQWGAAGPHKFDCSGLVQYVYSNLGVALPRVSGHQASAGVHVDRDELRPGDLVFFKLSGKRIDHVGIYVGKGKFIHAPRKHNPVRTDSLNDSWWRRKFKGGRRVG